MNATTSPGDTPASALPAPGAASQALLDLPPGRHGLSPQFVQAHQRDRLLRAVCEVCASRGYEPTTIADIVRAAGVSSRTFYAHFPNKQACFLTAYRMLLAELQRRLTPAPSAPTSRSRRVAAGLRELLDVLASQPTMARTLFVDVLFAGPPGQQLRQEALDSYQRMLPSPSSAPPGVTQAAVGGIVEVIYHTILEDRTSALPDMYDEMLYCLLTPLLGHEETVALCAQVGATLVPTANRQSEP